jgi:hypothetical protein
MYPKRDQSKNHKNSYLYIKDAKSYFDEPNRKIVVKAALRPRQDNLEVVKGFRSQGVHNILCVTRTCRHVAMETT